MSESNTPKSAVAADMGISAAAGAAGLVDPALAVAAAGVAPAVAVGVRRALTLISSRWSARAGTLLALAAQQANLKPEELAERLAADPELEQLLLRTLQAAGNTALREKIVAYSLALANSARVDDIQAVQWDTAFVRVLDDLDASHIELLRRFTMTSNELGLGSGDPAFDTVPASLNAKQVEMVASHLPMLPALLAVLQRHGLIQGISAGSSSFGGGGPGIVNWSLTSFGSDVSERLAVVAAVLQSIVEE